MRGSHKRHKRAEINRGNSGFTSPISHSLLLTGLEANASHATYVILSLWQASMMWFHSLYLPLISQIVLLPACSTLTLTLSFSQNILKHNGAAWLSSESLLACTNAVIKSSRVLLKSGEEREGETRLKEMETEAQEVELDATASHSIQKPSEIFFLLTGYATPAASLERWGTTTRMWPVSLAWPWHLCSS